MQCKAWQSWVDKYLLVLRMCVCKCLCTHVHTNVCLWWYVPVCMWTCISDVHAHSQTVGVLVVRMCVLVQVRLHWCLCTCQSVCVIASHKVETPASTCVLHSTCTITWRLTTLYSTAFLTIIHALLCSVCVVGRCLLRLMRLVLPARQLSSS